MNLDLLLILVVFFLLFLFLTHSKRKHPGYKKAAIVAFSFGLRGKCSPGESNYKLAETVDRTKKEWCEMNPHMIAQYEIAIITADDANFVVQKHRKAGKYLDSEEIAAQAIEYMESIAGKKEWLVLVVAHPFLHRFKCMRLFPGFQVKAIKTGWVPFDKKSIQPWTRGPIRFILYALRQILFGYKGAPTEELLKNN